MKASPVNQSQIWNFSDYPPPFPLVLISLALSHTTFQQEFGNFVISVLLLLDLKKREAKKVMSLLW